VRDGRFLDCRHEQLLFRRKSAGSLIHAPLARSRGSARADPRGENP
jgi:hypothetical protein